MRAAVKASGLTQEALAAQLNEKQQTISGWMLLREPRLDDLVRIEQILGKPRGFLLRSAGYVADATSARDAILGDPKLSESHRALLLATYDSAVKLASSIEARISITPVENPSKRSRS